MAYEVFISHSSKDRKIADAVCARLEEDRLRCWIAPRDIGPGVSWPAAIITALCDCKVMVLVLSQPSNASPQVFREVERAVHKGVIIIPFRIEDIEPSGGLEYFIGSSHWLDALTPPLQRHLDRLAETVGRLIPEHRPSPRDAASETKEDEKFVREFAEVALDDWARKPAGGLRGFFGRLMDET